MISFSGSTILPDTTIQPNHEQPKVFNPESHFAPAASAGTKIQLGNYLIVHENGMTISSHGQDLVHLLESEGVVVSLAEASDLLLDQSPLDDAIAVICDSSLGAENGTMISAAFIDLLVWADKPTILLGRSQWLLHSLRDEGPPQKTALASLYVYASPAYAGAVFLSSPYAVSSGSEITGESLILPVHSAQSEHSRLVNLTFASSASELAPLRYDSYPLDLFLLGMEDPEAWSTSGKNLLMNTIAYCTSLQESPVTLTLAGTQTKDILKGGFSYHHESSLESAYFAISAVKSILDASAWSTWRSDNADFVKGFLDALYVDLGTESAFMDTASSGTTGVRSTSQGLWISTTMGLSSHYDIAKLETYLANRQSVDGGYGNILSTYYVTQALYASGSLSLLDTDDLESWLRDCVITGADTSDPNRWGGIAYSPASTSPQNNYATRYLMALDYLGKSHDDPAKLTSWILTRTANGDGSFDNSLSAGSEPITGTASALTSMAILGTLSPSNESSGIDWIAANQLASGGYGLDLAEYDILAKTEETSSMALCFEVLDVTNETLLDGIASFIDKIKTPAGFEGMDTEPSLMWTYWISSAGRYSHFGSSIEQNLTKSYIELFTTFAQYPTWSNITAYLAPEYSYNQYTIKGVWTQFFGTLTAEYLGVELSSGVINEIVSYLKLCQSSSGHYRPTSFSGTAHMQYSVAAIEALYHLGALDSINYRSLLESMMLQEYSAGLWNPTGWTLNPLSSSQSAIDYLSTRAALRLELLNATMASEISSSIAGRIQYDDLWSLSRDVATLALLNSSFEVDLEVIDESQVLASLSSAFANGWFNSSTHWQPVYTQGVLEMISILGCRPVLQDVQGSSCSIIVPDEVNHTTSIEISIDIVSTSSTHSVFVYVFNEWLQFTDVGASDIIVVDIPEGPEALGMHNLSVMVWDYNSSRCFATGSTSILGSLSGSMEITNPSVLIGDLISGSVSWTLASGGDAGTANITIRLENQVQYQEWYATQASPLILTVPTGDFDAGPHNLTVTVSIPHCGSLVLQESVSILTPLLTYIDTETTIVGDKNTEIQIPWSLRFESNNSYISGQVVSILIRDQMDQTVHSDSAISIDGLSYFIWTPTERGNYSVIMEFLRNGTLEGNLWESGLVAMEITTIEWFAEPLNDQYSTVEMTLRLEDSGGEGLGASLINIQMFAPNSSLIYADSLTTNSTGYLSFYIFLDANGDYILEAQFEGTAFLHPSNADTATIAWSESSITMGGIDSEGLVNTTWNIWFSLLDSIGLPIDGVDIEIEIIYLPSTTVLQTTLTTNGTGGGSLQWIADNPGSYLIEVTFSGTSSRQSASASALSYLRIPVTLSFIEVSSYKVGQEGWCLIEATNHEHELIQGLDAEFVVRDPSGAIYCLTSVTTTNGMINVSFVPTTRGINAIYISSNRNSYYEAAASDQPIEVFDEGTITLILDVNLVAVSIIMITIEVTDSYSAGVDGIMVHTIITLEGIEILNNLSTTTLDGTIELQIELTNPGTLNIDSSSAIQNWLLSSDAHVSQIVKGTTSLEIDSSGMPISQGSTVGFLALLLDWESLPLSEDVVIFYVLASNGSIIVTAARTTGFDGTCAFAHTFNEIGDFVVRANYSGTTTDATSSHQVIKRVIVNPTLVIDHSPTSLLGGAVDFDIGIKDELDDWISDISLRLTVMIDGALVFDSQTPSSIGFVTVHWIPDERGLATIELSCAGSTYILAACITSGMSILEQVDGSLTLSDYSIDLNNQTSLIYELVNCESSEGVEIVFQVLDDDLIPIWTSSAFTNCSGIAEVVFTATTITGVLTITAYPSEHQFLIGGDAQEELIVMSYCHPTTALTPAPAKLGGQLNISIQCVDDLEHAIDGLSVKVYLYYLEQPIKLGYISNWITVVTDNGVAHVEFSPQYSGSYKVVLESSGSANIHGFTYQAYHIVHNPVSLEFITVQEDIEVGDTLHVVAKLTNYYGDAMVGHIVWFSVVGLIDPIDFVTNDTGYIECSVVISEEGQWIVKGEFLGVGVYLATSVSDEVDARYGTHITVTRLDNATIIANQIGLSISVLLEDTGGNSLEGRSIGYQVYHDTQGFLFGGSFVQTSQLAEHLNITLDRMGDHTILFSFAGTAHYHPSTSAIAVFVMGTSEIQIDGEATYDRSCVSNMTITLVDELGLILDSGDILVQLRKDSLLIDYQDRVFQSEGALDFSLAGLEVGQYTLEMTLASSPSRIGCTSIVSFNITSVSALAQGVSDMSGLIGQTHLAVIEVRDSLNSPILDAEIYVSIFDPQGKEIYGSILSTRTLVVTSGGHAEIEWTPTKTGNYSIIIEYEGTNFITSSSLTFSIQTRYETHMDVTTPESIQYPNSARIMVTLSGGVGKVSGAEIRLRLLLDGKPVEEIILTTDVRGLVQTDIYPSLAGNMTIEVEYEGSDIYAPSFLTNSIIIRPIVDVVITTSTNFFIGQNSSILVEIDIKGVTDDWIGCMNIRIYDSASTLLRNYTTSVSSDDILDVKFGSTTVGIYSVVVEISNVPIVGRFNKNTTFEISDLPPSIPMDGSSTTVMGSGIVLGLIGFAIRRRLSGAIESVSVEWDL